jgi:hypothetical protein
MVDEERDANLTFKTALEDTGDFKVDTFNNVESTYLYSNPIIMNWLF